jgi:ubiquinone/menaquinone biosynthesis C-methylase UbiE
MARSLFYELYHNLPRQGPGDNESTAKAFSYLMDLPLHSTLLDVGCGSGMQTLHLAKLINGHITAIDFHEPFLQQLRIHAEYEGLSEMITVLNESMFEMNFPDESFDVVWSEGSIYIYGFRKALADWKRLLIPGGYLVCSHISWLNDKPPDEVKSYWENEYPEITGIEGNIRIIREEGYTSVGHFVLPDESWWRNYYNPLRKRMNVLNQKYRTALIFQKLIEATKREMYMFKKYSAYYGYVFYIMKK